MEAGLSNWHEIQKNRTDQANNDDPTAMDHLQTKDASFEMTETEEMRLGEVEIEKS